MSQIGKPDKKITVAPVEEPIPRKEPVPVEVEPEKEPAK